MLSTTGVSAGFLEKLALNFDEFLAAEASRLAEIRRPKAPHRPKNWNEFVEDAGLLLLLPDTLTDSAR